MKTEVRYIKRYHKRYVPGDQHFLADIEFETSFDPVCPVCEKDIRKSYKFCPYCGCELVWVDAPKLPVIDGSSYRELEKNKLDELSRVMEELNSIEDES